LLRCFAENIEFNKNYAVKILPLTHQKENGREVHKWKAKFYRRIFYFCILSPRCGKKKPISIFT
jgi:hypothetical protein